MAVALEGFIKDFGIADIIQFLRQQNKTGILTIQSKDRVTRIFFEGGKIIWATTPETQKPEWIVRFLAETERIPGSEVERILSNQSELTGIESELLKAGYLSDEDLSDIFDVQTKEAIFELFRLKEGKYAFETTALTDTPLHTSSIEADFILLEGMRQVDEWPMIEEKLPSHLTVLEKAPELMDKIKSGESDLEEIDSLFEGTTVSEAPKDHPPPEDGKLISPEELLVYEFIDGERTLEDLIKMTGLGAFNTSKAVLSLLEQGVIFAKGEKKSVPILTQTVEAPKKKANPLNLLRSPWLWSNFFVISLMVGWTMTYAPNVISELDSWNDLTNVYETSIQSLKIAQIQEAAVAFYLRNGRYPNHMGELRGSSRSLDRAISDLENQGVEFLMTENGISIREFPKWERKDQS